MSLKIETIETCYQNTDPEMLRELIQFRNENVPKVFDYKGKAFEYMVVGSKDPTILMFHSAFGSADDIFQEVNRTGRYRIIAPTIRNLDSLDEICSAVNEMLRREEIDRIIVRGGSFGCFIAQAYFWRNFRRIDGIFFINALPPKGPYNRKDRWIVRIYRFLLSILPEKVVKKVIFKELSKLGSFSTEIDDYTRAQVEFIYAQVKERLMKVKKKDIIDALDIVIRFDETEVFKKESLLGWKGKILLVCDTEDPSYKYKESLLSVFPNPEYHLFQRGGHLLQLIYREEFNKVYDEFIQRVSSQKDLR